MAKTAEPAVIDQEIPDYNPALFSWDDLKTGAHEVIGSDLAKDALLDALVGVPFLIHRLTYRKSKFPKKDDPRMYAVVSCEAVIAPAVDLERRRVDVKNLPFDPGAQVVFNDSSTGIYRQVTAYLAATDMIRLPEPVTENGHHGESSYDLPPHEWASVNAGDIRFTDDGFGEYNVNVRLLCPRGLRISAYENEWSPDGKTRYLG